MNEIRKLLKEIEDNRHEVVCLSRKDRLDLDDHAEISRMNRRHQDLIVTLEAAVRGFVARVDKVSRKDTGIVYEELYNLLST